jgi:hypothetical protein
MSACRRRSSIGSFVCSVAIDGAKKHSRYSVSVPSNRFVRPHSDVVSVSSSSSVASRWPSSTTSGLSGCAASASLSCLTSASSSSIRSSRLSSVASRVFTRSRSKRFFSTRDEPSDAHGVSDPTADDDAAADPPEGTDTAFDIHLTSGLLVSTSSCASRCRECARVLSQPRTSGQRNRMRRYATPVVRRITTPSSNAPARSI